MKLVTPSEQEDFVSEDRSDYRPSYSCLDNSATFGILGSNTLPSVQEVDFEISVSNIATDTCHIYTCIQNGVASSFRPLDEVTDWRKLYPRLTSYNNLDLLDSELILLETKFDLLCDYPPPGSQLGITASIHIKGGPKYCHWLSSTHLYEGGVQITERNNIRWDDHFVDLEATSSGVTDRTKIELRPNCGWWASNVFGRILNDIRNARAQGNEYALQEAKASGQRSLEEMSLMQEIWATPRIKSGTPRRIATLLWNFGQIRDPLETATMIWRKLTTSNNTLSTAQSPQSSDLDRSTNIDSPAENIVMVQPADSCMNYSPKNNLFVDDAESIIVGQRNTESIPSTSTSDLRSLPSSIATSYVLPESGAFQALPSTQESSFTSPISAHQSFNSDVSSQESIFSTDDFEHYSQTARPVALDLDYLPRSHQITPLRYDYEQGHNPDEIIHEHNKPFVQHKVHPSMVQEHLFENSIEHDTQHYLETVVNQDLARQVWQHGQEDLATPAPAAPQNLLEDHIHPSVVDEYDRDHLAAPKTSMVPCCKSFDLKHVMSGQQIYKHDRSDMAIEPNNELQHYQDFIPLINPTHSDTRAHEEFMDKSSHPSSPHTSLFMRRPEPQQHHIDSVRWETYALWAAMDPQVRVSSENDDHMDDIPKVSSEHAQGYHREDYRNQKARERFISTGSS
jgi:hypothetical protein